MGTVLYHTILPPLESRGRAGLTCNQKVASPIPGLRVVVSLSETPPRPDLPRPAGRRECVCVSEPL